MEAVNELEITRIKNYKRSAWKFEIKFDWLYDQIPALITFVGHLQKIYNNENRSHNMSIRQNIDPK